MAEHNAPVGLPSEFDNMREWEREETVVKKNSNEKSPIGSKQSSPNSTLSGSGSSKNLKAVKESADKKAKLSKKRYDQDNIENTFFIFFVNFS